MQIIQVIFTCDINSVARLNFINKVVVSKQCDCMRCLSSWHIFRGFLQFDLAKTNKTKFNVKKKKTVHKVYKILLLSQLSISFSIRNVDQEQNNSSQTAKLITNKKRQ